MDKLKSLFFLFVFIQGIFYVFLIPPWQSPDETHHFGYQALLSKDMKLKPEFRENIDKKIIESMDTFHAWKYQSLPRPHPFPQSLRKVPFFHDIRILYPRAPLYYQLNSFMIKGFKINGILNQFYVIRSFSFILFLLTVYFTYLSARILFKSNPLYCLAAVSFVAFLPQFLIISTSVNPINLAVFLETVLIYLMFLSLDNGKKIFPALLIPIVIGLGFLNHRVALFMVPPFLVFLLIYFVKSLKDKRELLRIFMILLISIALFLALYLAAYHLFPDSLNKVVQESGLKLRIDDINKFIKHFSTSSSKSTGDFLDGFFKSFWYISGWMRFPYILDIYSILKLICLLSFLGLFKYLFFTVSRKNYNKSIDFKSFLILLTFCLPIVIGTIIKCFPIYEVAQGRYIFPAISAFAILFVLGLKEILPKRLERWLPVFIIVGFLTLDIYTIFNHLIRVFYYFTNA